MDELFKKYGFILSEVQLDKLAVFREMLLKQNEVMNLTTVTDPYEIAVKHFLDSMTGAPYLDGRRLVADIGSGAGFPAIPLSILLPDTRFIMIDSVNKKVAFIQTVIDRLKLNAKAVHIRIEDEARFHRESYDAVIARAVSPMPTLVEYALPLLKIEGLFLAYKAERGQEELDLAERALYELGGEVAYVEEFSIEEYDRTLIGIKKVRHTDYKYPRGGNKPRLAPL